MQKKKLREKSALFQSIHESDGNVLFLSYDNWSPKFRNYIIRTIADECTALTF